MTHPYTPPTKVRRFASRRTVLAASALLSAGFVCFSAPLQAAGDIERQVTFDIAAQPLDTALLRFSEQTGIQVTAEGSALKVLRTAGVRGDYPATRALDILLKGSGLTYKVVDGETIVIRPPAVEAVSSENEKSASGVLRLARAADEHVEATSAERAQVQADKGIAEILVKGSRTLNADIRRTEEDPQPYVVLGREEIQRSMTSNLEEFLRTRLPMNTVQTTNAQNLGVIFGNQSSVNLRGLGTNQTLILLDGRRMPSVSSSGLRFIQPDLNGIPLAAIERIEVLASTASGIYGGGATGGVINIITRKDYSSFDMQVTYGNTFHTDADNRRIDASAGFNLNGGRTHVLIAGSHAEAGSLLIGERDFLARARALNLANNPAAFFGTATPPQGDLPNIRSANGSNLVLKTGGALNSPFTFVPPGYTGTDAGAALVANAGQYSLGVPADVMGGARSLVREPTIDSVALNLRQNITSRIQGFMDFSRFENVTHDIFGTLPASTTLAASAPNNPFTTAINVSFPAVAALSLPAKNGTETLRAAGGLIVTLPRDWTVAADHVWGRSRWTYSYASPIVGDPDGAGPGLSVTAALSSGALNVMRDPNTYPLNFSPYLLPSPNRIGGPNDTTTQDTTLRISGPLLRIPGGALALSGYAERLNENLRASFSDLMDGTTATVSTLYAPERSQQVNAYYLELRAPLISGSNAKPAARALDLQVSARHDDYHLELPNPLQATLPSRSAAKPDFTTVNKNLSATTYTLGLRYSPVEDVVLRASYGTGFLPPSLLQLVPFSQTQLAIAVADPKRERVSTNIVIPQLWTSGDPTLTPEKSDSWSAGIILTPARLAGLRLSLDYTRTEKSDEIVELGLQQTLDLEDLLPGRIIRAPLTSADIAAGFTGGAITEFYITALNIAALQMEAYDLQADYAFTAARAGTFNVHAMVTRQSKLARKTVPGQSFVDYVGFNNSPLEWRANAGVTWERGPWTFGWDLQYFDSYFVYTATANAATRASAVLNQGSATIASQTYHDLFGRYRFDADAGSLGGALSNAELTFGIQNVLDHSPPILATAATTGGYSTYGDPRLRRFTLTLRKNFGR